MHENERCGGIPNNPGVMPKHGNDGTTRYTCPGCADCKREAKPKRPRSRLYSLFIKANGTRRWVRVSSRSYPKTAAVDMYQNALLAFTYQGVNTCLRAVTGPAVLPPLECKTRIERVRTINAQVVR